MTEGETVPHRHSRLSVRPEPSGSLQKKRKPMLAAPNHRQRHEQRRPDERADCLPHLQPAPPDRPRCDNRVEQPSPMLASGASHPHTTVASTVTSASTVSGERARNHASAPAIMIGDEAHWGKPTPFSRVLARLSINDTNDADRAARGVLFASPGLPTLSANLRRSAW